MGCAAAGGSCRSTIRRTARTSQPISDVWTGAAALARELGSPWCYYWIEPCSDDLTFAANTKLHVQRLRPIAEVLGEHGCRLGLEPIGPKTLRTGHRYEFVHTIPMALDLLAAVDRPNVGVLLDCFHLYTSHGDVTDVKALSQSQVVYVHINDALAGIDVDEQLDDVRQPARRERRDRPGRVPASSERDRL